MNVRAVSPKLFAGYLLPCVVLFVVHYNALRTWFLMDDFAWLGLHLQYFGPRDLLEILFKPQAQGTVRVLSERLFFLVFGGLFGMKAGPFHYWVFLTQCGSLILANAIVRRLSGSALAGIAAATLWALSHVTAVSLAWLSSYNEILCGFLMLAAFYSLIRGHWTLQWIFYLLGFLTLEVTVVYPAIACLYVWFTSRQQLKKALWLWIPSIAFTLFHFLAIPKSNDAAYKMTFDAGIIVNLGRYALNAVGPRELPNVMQDMPAPISVWVASAIASLLAIFIAFKLWKREWIPLLGLAWFVIFLGPILPLQNHFSDYYTTIASFGLAMLGGWAFENAMRTGWTLRILALAAVATFSWCEVDQAQGTEEWYRLHSGEMHIVLNGVDRIWHERHADAVLLAGIDDELYISGFLDSPFRLYGIDNVYLLPGSESSIRSIPKSKISMLATQQQADSLLASGKTIVAAFDGRGITDVTDTYTAIRQGKLKVTVVRMSERAWSSRLGPGWNDVEGQYRWMPARATVLVDTPSQTPARLYVKVYCPKSILDAASGKLTLKASIAGKPMGAQAVNEGEQLVQFNALSKEQLEQKQQLVELEISHVMHLPSDDRNLGIPVFEVGFKTP
ncbi:MAG TPA: hypothetical protein VGL53_16685 [Bryobacteraceae bacterium]